MNLPWFRLYVEFATDPVIQSLAFEDQRHYVVLLCLKCSGVIDRDISKSNRERIIMRGLGLDPSSATEAKRRLREVGLIDENWQPKGWEKRQFKSDNSTQRVRNHRKTKEIRNVTETLRNGSGNAPEQNRTETEQKPPKSPKGELPEWLDPDDWKAFKQHRQRLRKPMTERAEKLIITRLTEFRKNGHAPAALINRAIEKGWHNIYAPGNGADPNAEFK